ncbi:hypothetical protein [Natribacillus halophilus]|uniref:hypothetical protein n=1 Tax=Natribacillus halophilus TaxID=549003 RepID=UPI000B83F90F|nr:hypothetical protein [Natribacillus halophilus]
MNKKILYGTLTFIFAFNVLSACNGGAPEEDDLDEDIQDARFEDRINPEAETEDIGDDQDNVEEIYNN